MGGPVSLVEVRGCGLCPGGTRVGVSRTNVTNSEVTGSFLPFLTGTEFTLARAVWLVPANREVVASGNDIPIVPMSCCRP